MILLNTIVVLVKSERLLRATGSHVHWKSDNISQTMLNREVATTGH